MTKLLFIELDVLHLLHFYCHIILHYNFKDIIQLSFLWPSFLLVYLLTPIIQLIF